MPALITFGSSTIAPSQVMGYMSERAGNNVVHPILGREEPDVTLRPASLATGTLELGFQGPTAESNSKTAQTLASTSGVGTFYSSDRSSVGMTFVVTDRVRRELDPDSRDAWIVSIPWQEVMT